MPAFPPGASAKGGQAAIQTNVESARAFYAPILPVVAELHAQGLSLRQIARELDRRGVKTRLQYPGQRWNAMQVRRVLARIAAEGGVTQPAKDDVLPRAAVGGGTPGGVTLVRETPSPPEPSAVPRPENTEGPPQPEVAQSRFHRDQTSEELWKPIDWLAGRLPTG
jgi:hypothetical protein